MIYDAENNVIDWDEVSTIEEISRLKEINQHQLYHKEGNAFNHTKMVTEEMIKLINNQPNDRFLDPDYRTILVLAALLHDVGKYTTSQLGPDGLWHNPNHAIEGEEIAKDILEKYKKEGKIKIPQLTTDKYGHVVVAADEEITFEGVSFFKNSFISYTPQILDSKDNDFTIPADKEWHKITLDLTKLNLRGNECGIVYGNEKLKLSTFSIDTRKINVGEVYVAIKGERLDGNDICDEAVEMTKEKEIILKQDTNFSNITIELKVK